MPRTQVRRAFATIIEIVVLLLLIAAAVVAVMSQPGCAGKPAGPGSSEVVAWSPAEAALSVAEAAAIAAEKPGADREAVINAALAAAVDQAALVAPQLAIDPEWVSAVRVAIRLGLLLSKGEAVPPGDGDGSVHDRVLARTCEALNIPVPSVPKRVGGGHPPDGLTNSVREGRAAMGVRFRNK